eukprot:1990386-Amphidinium_carterae.1
MAQQRLTGWAGSSAALREVSLARGWVHCPKEGAGKIVGLCSHPRRFRSKGKGVPSRKHRKRFNHGVGDCPSVPPELTEEAWNFTRWSKAIAPTAY